VTALPPDPPRHDIAPFEGLNAGTAPPSRPAASAVGPSGPNALVATFVAWIAILAIVAVVAVAQNQPAKTAVGEADDSLAVLLVDFQARYYLGATSVIPGQEAQLLSQVRALESGSPAQRLRAAVVLGELGGPDAAIESLDRLAKLIDQRDPPVDEGDRDALEILRGVYTKMQSTPDLGAVIDASDRDLVEARVGWLGELAMAREGDAVRDRIFLKSTILFVTVIAMLLGALALGAAGTAGLVLLLVLWCTQPARFGIQPSATRTGVYAETFAIWLGLFIAAPAVVSRLPLGGIGLKTDLTINLVVFFASLIALAWPTMRGVSWAQVRRDIGLHRGRGFVVEFACGLGTYAMALPLVAMGVIVFIVLSGGAAVLAADGAQDPLSPTSAPAHPILEMVASGDRVGILLIYLLAAFAAPVVEEIVFRGVLHRHLRGMSRGLGVLASAAVSALVGGFIFAIVHPQGVLAVPLLMAMAVGFAIGREWRDSLIAPIVAHGINNFVVVTLMTVAFA